MRVASGFIFCGLALIVTACGGAGELGRGGSSSGEASSETPVVDELEAAVGTLLVGEASGERLTAVVGLGRAKVQDLLVATRAAESGSWEAAYFVFWNRADEDLGRERPVCERSLESTSYRLCQLASASEARALLDRVIELGAIELQDPKLMQRKERPIADGVSLALRVRGPAGTRDAHFNNPDQQRYPEAKSAVDIMSAMTSFRKEHWRP